MLRFSFHTRLTIPEHAYRHLCPTLHTARAFHCHFYASQKNKRLLSARSHDETFKGPHRLGSTNLQDSLSGYNTDNESKCTLCRYSSRMAVAKLMIPPQHRR